MDRAHLPLNALRAFEAAARHLNFTRAAIELCVSQGAVSHQVALLEARLGVPLFRRLPRGLALTDEGQALVPVVAESFDRIGATLDLYADGRLREVLTVGVVGTFAVGWLMRRLDRFAAAYPRIDLRVMGNNNRVDLAGEGLDLAIRFGDGTWHGTHAVPIMRAPLSPLCTPAVAARLHGAQALAGETLLRSYRADEWPRWFEAAGIAPPSLHGPVFDTSLAMVATAEAGLGIALAPPAMFLDQLLTERLVQPFAVEIETGSYWLTRLMSRHETPAMQAFAGWIAKEARGSSPGGGGGPPQAVEG
ncbi:LysR family transcriptional regulator [Sphingomonas sp. LB-2]|uniref:LysR family transcriptional regulator n=1 Tax=Sphingomonas caeni TaxID=2984949 RepID=UPI00223283E3|nr:LysR family transcriptional regulator [Sphingomonas caeni]MCW3849199.1 LysR family transcriptional regulator [Sphingomonas caeni]